MNAIGRIQVSKDEGLDCSEFVDGVNVGNLRKKGVKNYSKTFVFSK